MTDRAIEFAMKHKEATPEDYANLRNWFGHKMLATPYRWFVIKCIKDPLRKTIVAVAHKIATGTITITEAVDILTRMLRLVTRRMGKSVGMPTQENCRFDNTKVIFNIKAQFFENERNLDRCEMFDAAFDILAAIIEHDGYYESRFCFVVEELIKAVLDGSFKPRPEGRPNPPHWQEKPPYGGRHSIIAKIQAHREEINKIINSEAIEFNDAEAEKRHAQTISRIVNSLRKAKDPNWHADDGSWNWAKFNPVHSYKKGE